jgi:predicted MPP superfamily phosphohydrolase
MKHRLMTFLIFGAFFLVIDYYVFQALTTATRSLSPGWRMAARIGFWLPTLTALLTLVWWMVADPYRFGPSVRNWVITGLFALYFSKLFAVVILFVDDLQRGVRWLTRLFQDGRDVALPGEAIPRSEFLAKTALVAATVPFGTMVFGIISGAHDYRIRRVTVKLGNLPRSFDGIRIGQVSDIHSGSFFNKTAVRGGIDLIMKEKPDLIFFTGDLVNNEANEVRSFFDVFDKLRAPLGVFSVTGNHDYGDYYPWPSVEKKQQNFRDLVDAHRLLGYRLLMNEHEMVEVDGERIAILGIENWGAGRFAKYGRLGDAYRGTDEVPTKLLLSHDPSHWDAQVRSHFPDIDISFAGHTHGFQFGVELGNFKWSPSQYAYKQWAGLYQEGSQFLYVNRGYGYLGYPGRIGMPPELTIIELKRA